MKWSGVMGWGLLHSKKSHAVSTFLIEILIYHHLPFWFSSRTLIEPSDQKYNTYFKKYAFLYHIILPFVGCPPDKVHMDQAPYLILFTIQHYPPDQLVDELLRYPGWFASGSAVNLVPKFTTATLQQPEKILLKI